LTATHPASRPGPRPAAQRQWEKLFRQLERSIASQQETASDARSLQWGIDQFLASDGGGLTPRQLQGLDLKADSNWVQEYAARCGRGGAGWCRERLLRGSC
jgi:hypothetical protein